jgi:hypothetical protein
MADASMGHQAQLALDAVTPFDSSSEPYEFVSEKLRKQGQILDTSGIRGTRSHASERTREGTYEVSGSITLHASPAMLDNLLPRILGAAESTDTFDLAETIPEFQVMVDRVAKVFTYQGCKIDRATFRGSAGGLVELSLDILGKTESVGNAGTFPSLTLPTDPPYVMQDGVLTLLASARKFTDFEIVIDNALASRFSNSQTATDISPTDRIVTFRCSNPYTSDETDLYEQALAGAAATLVFTNGGYSTTFSFATLQFPDLSPVVAGKGEIPLTLEGIARKSGSTAELIVTHDSAP